MALRLADEDGNEADEETGTEVSKRAVDLCLPSGSHSAASNGDSESAAEKRVVKRARAALPVLEQRACCFACVGVADACPRSESRPRWRRGIGHEVAPPPPRGRGLTAHASNDDGADVRKSKRQARFVPTMFA